MNHDSPGLAIRTAAVLGAGTMGAQVAAHLANAGVPVRLFDVTEAAAREGLKRARAIRPDPFFTADAARLITTGGFDTGLSTLATADWIIEAVVERLDVKQALLAKVDAIAGPRTIVSSNTSGIPVAALADGRSERFRQRFLGTHFFNPPRYLHLLEVIPTSQTLPAVVEAVSHFADRHLGKGVVLAKDSPNFIANHLGLFGAVRTIAALDGFTDRRDRRHDRTGDRAAQERHVPDHGHRRPGRARGRHAQPRGAARR